MPYLLFGLSGILSLIGFIVLKRVAYLFDDRTWVLVSVLLGGLGYFLIIDFEPRQL
jgi:hypothetical protein